jgi:hypothetical protein
VFCLRTGRRCLVHHRQFVRRQAARSDRAGPGRKSIIDQVRGEPRSGHTLDDDGDVVVRQVRDVGINRIADASMPWSVTCCRRALTVSSTWEANDCPAARRTPDDPL